VLLDQFDGGQLLAGAVGFLRQVQIEHWRTSRPDVTLGQRVHHQQHVDRSLALPVAGDGVEQVLGREPRGSATAAVIDRGRLDPAGQAMTYVVEMTSKSHVQRPRQDVGQRLSARQQLTGAERRRRRGVQEVELQVDRVRQLERMLGVQRYVVPDACVRNVDRAEKVRRRRVLST